MTYHFAGAGKVIEVGSVGNLPAVELISAVEKRLKSTPPVLELEEKDAKGLVGKEES